MTDMILLTLSFLLWTAIVARLGWYVGIHKANRLKAEKSQISRALADAYIALAIEKAHRGCGVRLNIVEVPNGAETIH